MPEACICGVATKHANSWIAQMSSVEISSSRFRLSCVVCQRTAGDLSACSCKHADFTLYARFERQSWAAGSYTPEVFVQKPHIAGIFYPG